MKVEFGINPNCSELIIRLDGWTFEDAKKKLEKAGFEEAWIRDFYHLHEKKNTDWDENSNIERVTPLKYLPATTVALMRKASRSDEEIEKPAKKALKKLGYTDDWYDFDLIYKGNPPDYENGSTISLKEVFDGDEVAVVAHQHCQTQLYPMVYKISKLFGKIVEGYDGGSSNTYDEWVDAGMPDVKTWNPEE